MISVFLCVNSTGQSVSFDLQSVGTDSTVDAAIQHALSIWEPYLNSAVPIKIKISYINLTAAGPLGIAFPNGVKDFSAAPHTGTWYPTALANSISGQELNPGETDMDIYINSFFNWYHGIDGNPASNQYDLVSVLIHEICHGLGFMSVAKVDGSKGSFGRLTQSDFVPLGPSFPFPMLQGLPSIFDLMVINQDSIEISDTLNFPNDSDTLGLELQSNALYHIGPQATTINGNQYPRLYAPASFSLGSSILHLDENTYPPSDTNSMMTPFVNSGEVHHYPGPIVSHLLKDLGWPDTVVISGVPAVQTQGLDWDVFPNPFSPSIFIELTNPEVNSGFFEIYDIKGRLIQTENLDSERVKVDTDRFIPGAYLIRLYSQNRFENKLVIKK